MAQTIKLRRSAVQGSAPTTAQLALGELAINTYDGKLFLKKSVSGVESIVELGAGGTGDVVAANNNAFTGANTFTNATGQTFRQAATQDGILLTGRAGGTGSFDVTLTPATLSADQTLTLPDVTGTVVTTGDTGSVTSTMIANDTIVNADINTAAAIAGTKISPNFGAQLIQSSQANQALSLTGSLNPANTSNGLLSVGTLGFTGSRMGANFTSSQTSYYQVVLQNTSNNAGASCDFVVCNDASTDSATYGNLGINSSTYTGSGSLNLASSIYLTATTGDLVLGTTTANNIRIVYNSETTDTLTVAANDITLGKTLKPRTGTSTANTAPLQFTSGVNLTTAVAGAVEYDGTFLYSTPTTTSGRGQIPSLQTFRLAAAGGNITTIANFFGATSSINLAASSVYSIEAMAYFLRNTAGTVTWTLTASSAPNVISGVYQGSPVTGIAAGTPITGYAGSRAATTAAFPATASIANNVYMVFAFRIQVFTNLATTFALQATVGTGNITPQAGSFYTVNQISGTTGSFA